jgi:hypothetical protein
MAEVIFERFVDHSHQQLADSFDEFPFELELECPLPVLGRTGRADSVQRSSYQEDPAGREMVPWSGAGRGLAIPRRHTMDTAAFSLPAHLNPGRCPSVAGSLDPAPSPAARRHQPSLPGSSIPSLWSLRTSSPSPGIRRIPSILRRSLSKLFSSGRTKSPSPPRQLSVSHCPSQASIVSQQTEDIVRESLAKGLPIIPFAFPAFHNMPAAAPPEEIRDPPHRFASSRPQTARGDSVGRDAQGGYCNMERSDDGERPRPKISVTSQSSYVEMTTPCRDTSPWDEDPYVRMENVFANVSSRGNSSYVDSEPFNVATKKAQKIRTLLKPKNGLIIGQQYKKGNKHSDEYAFIDFGKNRETDQITNAQLHPFLSL